MMSVHAVAGSGTLDLPCVHLPGKALWSDVTVRGTPPRFPGTHLDCGVAVTLDW